MEKGEKFDQIVSLRSNYDGIATLDLINSEDYTLQTLTEFSNINAEQIFIGKWGNGEKDDIAIIEGDEKEGGISIKTLNLLEKGLKISFKTGKTQLLTGDYDDNKLQDLAIARLSNKRKAYFILKENVFSESVNNTEGNQDTANATKMIAFAKDARKNIPVSFEYRQGRHAIGMLKSYKVADDTNNRSVKIQYCLTPCVRRREIRIKNRFVENENLRPQIIWTRNGTRLMFQKKLSEGVKELKINASGVVSQRDLLVSTGKVNIFDLNRVNYNPYECMEIDQSDILIDSLARVDEIYQRTIKTLDRMNKTRSTVDRITKRLGSVLDRRLRDYSDENMVFEPVALNCQSASGKATNCSQVSLSISKRNLEIKLSRLLRVSYRANNLMRRSGNNVVRWRTEQRILRWLGRITTERHDSLISATDRCVS